MVYQDEILAEVRENKAKLIEKYGGIDGLRQHQREERPRMEQAGWKFVDYETVRALNKNQYITDSV